MSNLKYLFKQNVRWTKRITKKNPKFFSDLSKHKRPNYLWIGCSDNRVSANEILDLPSSEIFVHRNIANVVVHSDLNFLSVLQYAIEVLRVQHIIVCGHYDCSGVKASMDTENTYSLIDNWIEHIRDVAKLHINQLNSINNKEDKLKLLCELNVIEQVVNVYNTTIVKNALKNNQNISVHGWIYSVSNGIIKDLHCSANALKLD